MSPPRLRPRTLPVFVLLLAATASALGQTTAPAPRLEGLLQELRGSGVDIIYSSELVTKDMKAPPAQAGASSLQRLTDALAANGLALRTLGSNQYVVVRAENPAREVRIPEETIEEISVYASRYAIQAGLAEPRELSSTDIERVPGSHDDALRSLHSLPGIATNGSARPYIRGSLSEDILVRYDGIPLLDPFHLKNFQSLISAVDPAAIESIEVFSGGFPVRYGTRSGGVIDITAPSYDSGHEYRANLSLISAGVSSIGKSERWPVEWLAAGRRSTLDLLDPVEDGFGKPEFRDSVGRVRWTTGEGAWTVGWLLLDDRLELGSSEDEEFAVGRYRDEYVWLARDHRFSDGLRTRASVVVTSAERGRVGTLQRAGVASGVIDETRSFNGFEISNDWTFERNDRSTYTFGGTIAATRADYRYLRHSEFTPEIAAAFGRGVIEDQQFAVQPEIATYALYVANRRKWNHFEMELGLRLDAQHYEFEGNHTQVSPRLNLRYDFADQWRLYSSIGRFTQAQHVEEWRVEEEQQVPDAAQVSIHSILGLEYETSAGTRVGLEAYSKRWTTASAYFDSQLDPFALLPELSPDRVRIDPDNSEAVGLELSVHTPLSDRLAATGTLAWARVADEFGASDIFRSWDQPLSLNAGLSWKGASASWSALAGWHRGWPKTTFDTTSATLGRRNSARWDDFLTLDLRGSWTWVFDSGDLSMVMDVTNATNHGNECCIVLEAGQGAPFEADINHWLPALINIGFTYRWRSR